MLIYEFFQSQSSSENLWSNVFEVSPHVINAVLDGIEGIRVALGTGKILFYTLQGMFTLQEESEKSTGKFTTIFILALKMDWSLLILTSRMKAQTLTEEMNLK
eukprot:403343136